MRTIVMNGERPEAIPASYWPGPTAAKAERIISASCADYKSVKATMTKIIFGQKLMFTPKSTSINFGMP